jgi:hypothetical protein
MRYLARALGFAILALTPFSCTSDKTTVPDPVKVTPLPEAIAQHKPGDVHVPGTQPPPTPGKGAAVATPPAGTPLGGFLACDDTAPVVACGVASAKCTDGTFTCSDLPDSACRSHGAVKCVYCPGPLCAQ